MDNGRERLDKMKKVYIKKEKQKKICPVCNKEFLGKEGQISCSNYCSQRNYAKLHPRPKRDRNRYNSKREKNCPFCKINFYDKSTQNTMQFCCGEHSNKFYKENIIKPKYYNSKKIYCKICNNSFLSGMGSKANLPICSVNCMIEYLKKFNELGYILGVIASDGFITKNNKQMGMTVKDKDYAEEFQYCLKKIFPFIEFKLYPHSDGRFRVYCTRRIINEALNSFFENGSKTYTWTIPKILLKNKSMASQFLSGFFDGEAAVNTKKKYISIQCYSVNENGLKDLAKLLSQFDISYTPSKFNRKGIPLIMKKNKKIYYSKSDMYALCINKFEDIQKFYNQIRFKIKRKNDKVKKFLENFKYEVLPWNQEESEILKDKSLTARELSKKLNISINRIKNRRRHLGISFWRRVDWTPEQIKILKDNYGKINNKELSVMIRKPIRCLITKMYRLKNRCKAHENIRQRE